jgi:hypothetical protein
MVDARLGGAKGLAIARKALAEQGMGLMLDFVPNHVAPDHPWEFDHPDYFIRGDMVDLERDPASFISADGNVFACGCDPYFPAWPDVLQLNSFNERQRSAVVDTVSSIADQCDGVRCDMAMLVMNDIFRRTWGDRAGKRPVGEYWPEVIGAVRKRHPDFLFMAEAYWDLEWEMQRQGFDYCYDKKLYERLVRFIENHDEPRAAATFSPGKERAAALLVMTLPGAKLLHHGQLEGMKVRLPVFLGRRPEETVEVQLRLFYGRLLQAVGSEAVRDGEWRLCERSGWPDNQSCMNLVAWCWRKGEDRRLVIVNLSSHRSQGRIRMQWIEMDGRCWRLYDLLSGGTSDRDGGGMINPGVHMDPEGWAFHFFHMAPVTAPA